MIERLYAFSLTPVAFHCLAVWLSAFDKFVRHCPYRDQRKASRVRRLPLAVARGLQNFSAHMSLKRFRCYQLAVRFFNECEKLRCSRVLRDQLDRASSSIVLNLAEGTAKPTAKDRARFYSMAFGSLRECQAILELAKVSEGEEVAKLSDELARCLYVLTRETRRYEDEATQHTAKQAQSGQPNSRR